VPRLSPEELSDRVEIADLFVAYGEALDKRDWALLDDVFLPDVTAYWPYGSPRQVGRESVVAHIKSRLDTFATTHHQFGNHRVRFGEDGESAFATCRARNYHAGSGEFADRFVETLGTFEAELVRTAAGWRVREWRLVFHDRLHGWRGDDWQPAGRS
jgi:hypothetical protein